MKMDTPICDFVRDYAASGALRLHMPGHKGRGPLGMEALDITEIDGADSLYEAQGIIRRSEQNAGALFGCETFYSTEGSSLCIRAMLYLALLHGKKLGRRPIVAAGRNAHKAFLSAAALLDFKIEWIVPEGMDSYLKCPATAQEIESLISNQAETPVCVYLTSPDYLGNIADVRAIAKVCHRFGVLLLVDNAHGAYLRFLPESSHPMELGADMCCDSAHKTLPVLTGGAYLHISPNAPQICAAQAKNALALFGSTSPSYLILQSLDAANAYLAEDYRSKLQDFRVQTDALKKKLVEAGYVLCGDEPLKLSIFAKARGLTGRELADALGQRGIVSEFADPDFCVLMLTPEIGLAGLASIEEALLGISAREPLMERAPVFRGKERALTVREALFCERESLPTQTCEGKILAAATVSCPPAVPIVVCGERIDGHAVECLRYYGVERCWVVKE